MRVYVVFRQAILEKSNATLIISSTTKELYSSSFILIIIHRAYIVFVILNPFFSINKFNYSGNASS